LAGGRLPGRTWEPDVLVTYRGRAGVLEIDGPHHNRRRAFDTSREHLFRQSGVALVDRVTVEAIVNPDELMTILKRFLKWLAETR
jgi:very-short-patch-repair endonuclease